MKILVTVLFTLASAAVGAAVPDLEVDFTTLSHTSNYDLLDGNTIWCPGWSFTTCYSAPASVGTLLVGKTDEPGQFTTQNLPLNGNASVIFEVKKSGSATITASITGGGSLLTGASKTIDKDCNVVFYVKEGTPSTRLTITGTAGKFHVKNMRVYNIGDAVFYESFDYMEGNSSGEFYPSNSIATAAMCDNDEAKLTNIYQSRKSICIRYFEESRASSYAMPIVPIEEACNSLLSFKIGHIKEFGDYFSLTCSGNSDADMAFYNPRGSSNYSKSLSVELEESNHSNWIDKSVIIRNMNSSTILTYEGYGVNLNDILVRPLTVLDEASNIEVSTTKYCSVELIRKLTPNTWCPLCLPFNVTQSQMEDAMETTCELRTLTDIRGGVFIFDKVTSVSAGTPFLIKVNTLVENPVFTGVTVVDTPAATATGSAMGYSFVGTYSPVSLNTNGTHLFLDKEGNLCQPDLEEGYNRLNGLRAYFVVPASATEARVFISDATANVSRSSITSTTHHKTYDLSGRQANTTYSKGLRIRNGRKILTR